MEERGQSEVVGFVLLLGLVVAGTTGIVVLGADAISDTRGVVTSGAAEHSMTQFDSKASLVAHGGSDSQSARLAGASTAERSVEPDRGWMNVTIRNESDPSEVDQELMNVTLGAVVYEDGDATIAYQGGGVWRTSGDGSTMVSPPEFHYHGTTLTLPLVTIDGDAALGERSRVTQGGPERSVYPNESAPDPLLNPLETGEVYVEVGSEFYEAWGRFFAGRTGGQVSVDHENETATIRLVIPPPTEAVDAALASSSAGEELQLSGSGGAEAFVDSYDSTDGPYDVSRGENGTVSTAGDLSMSGNSRVVGNVEAGESADLKGSSNVTKEVRWTTGFSAGGNAEYGTENQIDGVTGADSIESFVVNRGDFLAEEGNNHNDNTTAIDDDRLVFSDDSATISASDGDAYYLEKINMDGQDLVIETEGEQVEIVVDSDVDLRQSNVTVEGVEDGGVVRLYAQESVYLDDGANVSVPGDEAKGLWVYGTSDTYVSIAGSSGNAARFVGVIYAPTSGGDVDVDVQHASVYGGIVAGEMDVSSGGSVHYDEALENEEPLPEGASVPRVTYLHVSVTPLEVEDQ